MIFPSLRTLICQLTLSNVSCTHLMELSRPPFKQRIKPQFRQFHYTKQKWHMSPAYSPLSRPGESKFCGPKKKFGLQNQQEPNRWRKELDQTRMTLPVYGKFKPETVKLGNIPCSSLHDGCALFMANSNKQQLKYEMFHEDSLLVSQPVGEL